MRRAGGMSSVAGAALIVAAMATPAAASVHLAARPKLTPRFLAGATDYVTRCERDKPVRLDVRTRGGDRVSVAGRSERSGEFSERVTLRPGQSFAVRARPATGLPRGYHVRCLPKDFPTWSVNRPGVPKAQWYVTAPVKRRTRGYVAIFDAFGVPVWWRRFASTRSMPWDAKVLDDGLLTWGRNSGEPFGVRADGGFEQRTLGGRRVRQLRTRGSPTDLHDLERLPNGHFLAITYRQREDVDMSLYGGSRHARVFDGVIQELTPAGGVAWQWNSRDHVDPAETQPHWRQRAGTGDAKFRGHDLLHVNSVEPDGDGLVVSARHLDAVFRISRVTGEVQWKLGGSFVPGKSLAVLGVPAGQQVFGGQHDARVLPDGTVTVFDNRTRADGAPAAVRFRVDPIARTATRIEHVAYGGAPEARWGGSTRRLRGGHWVTCWGGTDTITEQRPGGGVVFALRLGDGRYSYRAQPLEPGTVGAGDLRRGMDLQYRHGASHSDRPRG